MKKFTVLTIMLVVIALSANAMNIELKTYSIVNEHWKANDALTQNNQEAYQKHAADMDKQIDELAEFLSANRGSVKEFSEVYKTLPQETKPIFNALISEIAPVTRDSEDLFPGYGYAEPGFYYRRGAEEKIELLQKYWKTEERTFEKNYRYKFYVELKVSTEMQQNAQAGGNIEGFDVKGVYGITINGELKQCAEVEFSTKETLKTRCVVQYEKNKIWYELFKAKKGWFDWLPWTDLTWTKAGSTYVISEEATETEVILEAPQF